MKISKYTLILPLVLSLFSTAYASNYACPAPSAILVIDFTMPPAPPIGLWIGPAEPTSNGIGNGIGGDHAGAFIGAEQTTVNGNPNGWTCFYGSSTHASAQELYQKMDQVPARMQPYIGMLAKKSADVSGLGMVTYTPNN